LKICLKGKKDWVIIPIPERRPLFSGIGINLWSPWKENPRKGKNRIKWDWGKINVKPKGTEKGNNREGI